MAEGITVVNETIAINRYFGKLPGQSNADFLQEMKALSVAEKHYLAVGAAKALGLTQEKVSFTLD